MKKFDLFGLISSIVMGISIFLPFWGDHGITLPGIAYPVMWGVLVLAGVGIFFSIKKNKLIIIPGAISLIMGIILLANVIDTKVKFRFMGESVRLHISEAPKTFGLYIFLIASIAVVVAGVLLFAKKKE